MSPNMVIQWCGISLMVGLTLLIWGGIIIGVYFLYKEYKNNA